MNRTIWLLANSVAKFDLKRDRAIEWTNVEKRFPTDCLTFDIVSFGWAEIARCVSLRNLMTMRNDGSSSATVGVACESSFRSVGVAVCSRCVSSTSSTSDSCSVGGSCPSVGVDGGGVASWLGVGEALERSVSSSETRTDDSIDQHSVNFDVPFRRRVRRSMMKRVLGNGIWFTRVESHAREIMPRKTRKPTA